MRRSLQLVRIAFPLPNPVQMAAEGLRAEAELRVAAAEARADAGVRREAATDAALRASEESSQAAGRRADDLAAQSVELAVSGAD